MKWDPGEEFWVTKSLCGVNFPAVTKESAPVFHICFLRCGEQKEEKRMKLKGYHCTNTRAHTHVHTMVLYPFSQDLQKIGILKLIFKVQCLYHKGQRILKPKL